MGQGRSHDNNLCLNLIQIREYILVLVLVLRTSAMVPYSVQLLST